jgi:DNA topoisomerase-1
MVAPISAAREAGLRYVSDADPGIRRRRTGRGFSYIGADGQPICDSETLRRIKSIVIPPAWTDVWIAPSANAHIQATGRDARGRKQYCYHPRWRAVRDAAKYEHLLAFGEALPSIRARTAADLRRPGLPREKVLAAVVSLLEGTLIRVGNEEYARVNRSFGLTTLQTRHVRVDGTRIRFHFRGKSGVEHTVGIADRRLSRIVRQCQELPGHELFQYVDATGERRAIGSEDVNAYLREISGQDVTAKDFRTWGGTLLAAQGLLEAGGSDDPCEAARHVVTAIKRVAAQLGNTPAVCRACYVHPSVIEAYLAGAPLTPARSHATLEETDLIAFLRNYAAGLAEAS